MLDYQTHGDVAVLKIDDGKANAVGHAFIDAVNEGLDQAETAARATVLVGRPGVFSAGFDLKEIRQGGAAADRLVTRGGQLLLRLFSHPQPVIAASTGHAVAAGAFMLLAADNRILSNGDYRIGLNETAIGMVLPVFGLELANARLSRRYLTRAVIQSELFSPAGACDAGFGDEVGAPAAIEERALAVAAELAKLDTATYGAQKRAVRAQAIATISASLQPQAET